MSIGLIREWKFPPYKIEMSEKEGVISANVTKRGKYITNFPDHQIKIGLLDDKSLSEIDEKVECIRDENIFPFLTEKELWLFPASSTSYIEVGRAKLYLRNAAFLDRNKIRHYINAEKCLRIACEFFKYDNGERGEDNELPELNKALWYVHRKRVKLEWMKCAEECLSDQNDLALFNEELKYYMYFDDFTQKLDALVRFGNNEPYNLLMSAKVHEYRTEYPQAFFDYCVLATHSLRPERCYHYAYSLLQKLEGKEIIRARDKVRESFQKHLENFKPIDETKVTCFICFNIEEVDVRIWLEDNFKKDLELFGISPILCLSDLNIGDNLDQFQEKARTADLAVIACTPALRKKNRQREISPIGLAQELSLIKGRFNDRSMSGKTYPLFLKGSRSDSMPSYYFENMFGTKFSLENSMKQSARFDYFYTVFQLFASMRDIPRQKAREQQKEFLKEVGDIFLSIYPKENEQCQ